MYHSYIPIATAPADLERTPKNNAMTNVVYMAGEITTDTQSRFASYFIGHMHKRSLLLKDSFESHYFLPSCD